jgi:acyl-coenzyme A thioesterase PaaI-like protein
MSETELHPEIFQADELCFGCGPKHPIGLRLRFSKTENEVLTRFTPGAQYQGPPSIMHGGLVMTAADELAAWTLIGLREVFGFTVSFEGKLRKPIRIGQPVEGRGRIVKESTRIARTEVVFVQQEAEAFRGEFTFALMDEKAASQLLGMSLPEAWKRFCR